MGEVKVFVTRDATEFAERTAGFLVRRPVEHNVLATVLAGLEPGGCTDRLVFAWVASGASGKVLGAALRTQPRRLLASTMVAEVAERLMPALLDTDPELPGINGPQPAASYLAEAWRRCSGGTVEAGMSQAIYWLSRVNEPARLPAGDARPAGLTDRNLIVEWARAFSRDAGLPEADAGLAVERRLRDGRLFIWDHDGAVSMVGTSPPVAGVVRLGPVFTPLQARRRGYASALVADVSRRALAAGATRCMLYTDLANATSNNIYQAVGYRRSTDAQEYLFHTRP